MPRLWIVILALLIAVGVAQQLLIPPLAEDQVEERIERFGGQVRVDLSAFPALRLLADDGERIEVVGSGLELDLRMSRWRRSSTSTASTRCASRLVP